MNEPDVMVYLMTGFLDSGKSQFLKFTLTQDYFQIDGTTLLILCEEGEEEFDPLEMAKHGVKIIKIEEQEELTEAFLNELHEKYSPERVVIEYNGMWKVSDFEALSLPQGWEIEQKLTTVDASTFQMYLNNLKPLFVEMAKHGVKIIKIEEQEELTEAFLNELHEKYSPERVVIEYNGMWKVSDFEALNLPEGWEIEQKLTTVDASTFQMYLNNLKPLFVEMVRGAELVLFNRCTDIEPLAGYRRSVKVVSPQAEVIFEDENGEIENIFGDDVPYDLNAPVIEIPREDYGIWYVDVMENPDRYKGKVIEFTAKVLKPKGFPSKVFLPGRMAMTCCADDTTFLGYICKSAYAPKLQAGEWVKVRAKVQYGHVSVYKGTGPILEAEHIEEAEPIEELVYFN